LRNERREKTATSAAASSATEQNVSQAKRISECELYTSMKRRKGGQDKSPSPCDKHAAGINILRISDLAVSGHCPLSDVDCEKNVLPTLGRQPNRVAIAIAVAAKTANQFPAVSRIGFALSPAGTHHTTLPTTHSPNPPRNCH